MNKNQQTLLFHSRTSLEILFILYRIFIYKINPEKGISKVNLLLISGSKLSELGLWTLYCFTKSAISDEHDGWSELPSQAVAVFSWLSKKHAILHCPDWRLCIFCWLIQDTFYWALLSFGSCTCWDCLVGGGSFLLLCDLFHSPLLYSIHFSLHITICFRNGAFPLHISRESHEELWSRRFFSA